MHNGGVLCDQCGSSSEAALEETKLAKRTVSRQRTHGQVAGKAVGVGHFRYGSRFPNRGAFRFCIQNIPLLFSP